MTAPSPRVASSRRLATLLRDEKGELIRRWTQRVLEDPDVPEANRLTGPELRNQIPTLIDNIAGCLGALDAGEASGQEIRGARDHASQRIAMDYSLIEALRELSHVRAAILDFCAEEGIVLEVSAAQCLHAAIDQAMISGAYEMEQAVIEKFRQQAGFRERFIGILGHDLRNPLQAIRFVVGTLLKHPDTTEPQGQLIRRIGGSVERMVGMIASVLDATRARLGSGIPIEPKPADLLAIVRQAVDELAIAHPIRTLQLDARGDLGGVWDPDRLVQVVSNLVSNALDYSPADTPVRVLVREEGAGVLLCVNNQGPTIADETMVRMFDPFVQGAQGGCTARGQGLGLGLFIAKNIVEGHGGSVEVSSTAQEGTTFTVRLPRDAGVARACPHRDAGSAT